MKAEYKKVLITGMAGFIGFSLAQELAQRHPELEIIGIDNLNDYYSVQLKMDRLAELEQYENISFIKGDISDFEFLKSLDQSYRDIDMIFHLAAQAGVRSSVDQPFKYINYNIDGQVAMLEFAKLLPDLQKIVYASSSSVYSSHTKLPFKETLPLTNPMSLYAATKQAGELMCSSYSRLFDMPMVGLRFFTAYGPYGRPDMAIYKIAQLIRNNNVVELVGEGKVSRDFTYIDDIVDGIIRSSHFTPKKDEQGFQNEIFNLGCATGVDINTLTQLISEALNREAKVEYVQRHATDMNDTLADISKAQDLLGYHPKTDLKKGVLEFVKWHQNYSKI